MYKVVIVSFTAAVVIILPFVVFLALADEMRSTLTPLVPMWIDVSTALFAVAAGVGAWMAALAANEITVSLAKDEKTRRTLDLSPYNSEQFLKSRRAVDDCNDQPENSYDAFCKDDLKSDRLLVLNHWGRVASAYEAGLLDQELADRMFAYGFVKYVGSISNYVNHGDNRWIYADTIKRFEDWSMFVGRQRQNSLEGK